VEAQAVNTPFVQIEQGSEGLVVTLFGAGNKLELVIAAFV
jgi:hypothetical protein